MKKFILYILFSSFSVCVVAQSKTTSFDVEGIKVILKPTVKEIISVSMFYRGGVTNYAANQAGIEDLTLSAATECGTKKYSKNAFKDLQDQYGIDIGGSSGYDYGNIRMKCISKYFNEGWDLFAESIVNPVFEKRELELIKSRLINSIKQNESEPDDYIDHLAMKTAFVNTPYAVDPSGEEAILAKLNASDIQNYYKKLLNKNRMFLVVAGKISKEELIQKIKSSFASIPANPYTAYTYAVPAFTQNTLFTEERELATNYITGIINAPKMDSDEYVPYRLAISILSGNLFREIRTKRNLSYAPGAHSSILQMPYTSVYVSTVKPKETIEIMVDQITKLKNETVTQVGLISLKSGFFTTNYMKEESSDAMTTSLGQAEIMGNWKMAEELPAKINAATGQQIFDAARKYISGIKWSYLGDLKLAKDAAPAFSIAP